MQEQDYSGLDYEKISLVQSPNKRQQTGLIGREGFIPLTRPDRICQQKTSGKEENGSSVEEIRNLTDEYLSSQFD